MEELIRILTEGNYSLVLEKDGQRYTFTQRGVADLHALYHAPEHLLDGAMLADKVVGKGAAALMIAGGVRRVHTLTVSERPTGDAHNQPQGRRHLSGGKALLRLPHGGRMSAAYRQICRIT